MDRTNTLVEELPVEIPFQEGALRGSLIRPGAPKGLVLFAHGSGSSRLSPRNRWVAQHLNHEGFATFLFDLLTGDEENIDERTRKLRFDIGLLSRRLILATDWAQGHFDLFNLPVGYFGASTGAAAALVAATHRPNIVKAVVTRGGRPDLAGAALSLVKAPTLFLVGENDPVVIEMNQEALRRLQTKEKKLKIIPHASHLFEEPGALEQAAKLAQEWFDRYLALDDRSR